MRRKRKEGKGPGTGRNTVAGVNVVDEEAVAAVQRETQTAQKRKMMAGELQGFGAGQVQQAPQDGLEGDDEKDKGLESRQWLQLGEKE